MSHSDTGPATRKNEGMNAHDTERKPVIGELVEEEKNKGPLSTLMVLAVGVVMAVYLLNPFLGVFELLPDNLPVLGNLEEVVATTVLIGCLSHLGIELPWLRSYAKRSSNQTKG